MDVEERHKDLPYRPCVGIMVLNEAGRVWIGRRNDFAEILGDAFLWQMPQGGLDPGEDPWQAARRELFEETSIRSVTLLAESPDWYAYDLPLDRLGKAMKGRFRGQTQKWFAVRFSGDEAEIDIENPGDGDKPEFDQWRWADMEELPSLIVEFKRPVYEKVVAAFRHLAG